MWAVFDELTRTLNGQFTLTLNLDLDLKHKYIIFSDQHKGAKDNADDFRNCEDTYVKALEYYLNNGFSLILLGDVEELWEQGFKSVEKKYSNVLQLEGKFPPGRYIRIWGNHDDYWMNYKNVRKKLSEYMPVAVVYEAIRFEVIQDSKYVGRILMVHGHQGTFESDIISGLARLFIRFIYRPLQRLTGIGRTTPAEDFCLREKHDKEMYKWTTQQNKLLLITGHTHRPVWTSRTHLQKLESELKQLKTLPDTADKEERIEEITKQIEIRKEEYKPCDESKKDEENDNPLPVYFNTGCCRYEDGDITGIEIEDGNMRLIKWPKDSDARELLEEGQLIKIFNEI